MTNTDEFAHLQDNADEGGLSGPLPQGARVATTLPDGTAVSAIRWGHDPKVVLLHGGGQNAHTWDTVVLALDVDALAVDLPGHGHSDWRADRDYWPVRNAAAAAAVMQEHAPGTTSVVGMSLGGLTAIRLAGTRPDLVQRVVVVDVTPAVHQRQTILSVAQRGTTALTAGPTYYDSYEAIVEATAAHAAHRPMSNIRRGVLHNARPDDDGRWSWRYDQVGLTGSPAPDFGPLWDDLGAAQALFALVTGGDSQFVAENDVAEFVRRRPGSQFHRIPDAGHSIQSDQPLALADVVREFLLVDTSA
jgi:esterase